MNMAKKEQVKRTSKNKVAKQKGAGAPKDEDLEVDEQPTDDEYSEEEEEEEGRKDNTESEDNYI